MTGILRQMVGGYIRWGTDNGYYALRCPGEADGLKLALGEPAPGIIPVSGQFCHADNLEYLLWVSSHYLLDGPFPFHQEYPGGEPSFSGRQFLIPF